MRIRNRISIGYVMLLLLMIVQGTVTVYLLNDMRNDVVGAVRNDFYAGLEFNRILVKAQQIRRYEKELFIYVDDTERRQHYYEEWFVAINDLRYAVRRVIADPEGVFTDDQRQAATGWLEALEFYADGFQDIALAADRGGISDPVAANGMIRDYKNRFRDLLDGAEAAGDGTYRDAEEAVGTIPTELLFLIALVGAIVAAATLIAVIFMVTMPKFITRPIEDLTRSATRMSMGDLSQKVSAGKAAVEFHELAETLERMRLSQRLLMDRQRQQRAL